MSFDDARPRWRAAEGCPKFQRCEEPSPAGPESRVLAAMIRTRVTTRVLAVADSAEQSYLIGSENSSGVPRGLTTEYIPCNDQCFSNINASKVSGNIRFLSSVMNLFAWLKTLSSSADIAGIDRVSKAHCRSPGYSQACHQWNRFSSFHSFHSVTWPLI